MKRKLPSQNQGMAISIPKKGSRLNYELQRGLRVLSAITKILAKIIPRTIKEPQKLNRSSKLLSTLDLPVSITLTSSGSLWSTMRRLDPFFI